jgi:ADP-ribosyl-[dinitrogen reductase] hydrolase
MTSGQELTHLNLANKFVEVFKRDPRPGYGRRMYEILQTVSSGAEFIEKIDPNSARSGACMRAGPIGFYYDQQKVLDMAALQASLTHNTPDGMMAAQAIALMTNLLVYGEKIPNSEIGQRIESILPNWAWGTDWVGPTSVMAIPCAHAAITAVKHGKTYRDVLERSVAFGGDVDTVAAMAMFAVSLTKLPNDLPLELYDNLEHGKIDGFGIPYLRNLDVQLRGIA